MQLAQASTVIHVVTAQSYTAMGISVLLKQRLCMPKSACSNFEVGEQNRTALDTIVEQQLESAGCFCMHLGGS